MDGQIADEHRQAITELRQRVCDVAGAADFLTDQQLQRWLVIRNYNVTKAEEMFKKSMEWRSSFIADLDTFEAPEVLKKYVPLGVLGKDIAGGQVLVLPQGLCDIRGLLASCSSDDYLKYLLGAIECQQSVMIKESKTTGNVCQMTVLFDLDGFSVKDYLWKPALEFLIQLLKLYEANYPDMLRVCHVLNTPKLFHMLWNLLKPFLHEETQKRVELHGRIGWQEILLKDISPEVLPKFWGGNRFDPDGDEKCPSVVCWGGPVPDQYYLVNVAERRRQNMNKIVVAKGQKTSLIVPVTDCDSLVRWRVETEHYDIGMGLELHDGEVIRPVQRLQLSEGEFTCHRTGIHRFVLDNSFSYLRSKVVFYDISTNETRKYSEKFYPKVST